MTCECIAFRPATGGGKRSYQQRRCAHPAAWDAELHHYGRRQICGTHLAEYQRAAVLREYRPLTPKEHA